ncbi:hypothetical protein PBI_TRISCUIT_5 [Microbacterium phage Triscuit]|nr:hypothetical protein PBI_TRISCUIT_110 [Microbacterium phage Triscuit]AVR56982.1 hypothetical protein PBI_TRISCUIT_5 [Microbacterium phage Triscuit]
MKNLGKNLIAVVVVTACMAGVGLMATQVADDKLGVLPPCATEDSDNCYWDASRQGNGEGRSFSIEDGVVTYWDETQR